MSGRIVQRMPPLSVSSECAAIATTGLCHFPILADFTAVIRCKILASVGRPEVACISALWSKHWIPGVAFGRALLASFGRSRNPFRFPPMRVTIPDAEKGKGPARAAVPLSRSLKPVTGVGTALFLSDGRT
jgi:hypothetical protein